MLRSCARKMRAPGNELSGRITFEISCSSFVPRKTGYYKRRGATGRVPSYTASSSFSVLLPELYARPGRVALTLVTEATYARVPQHIYEEAEAVQCAAAAHEATGRLGSF